MANKKSIIMLLILGSAYYFVVKYTHFYIPCMFHFVTGLKCPGCGITTMIMALGRFDIVGAFWANPFLFVSAPFIGVEIIYMLWRRNNGLDLPKWNSIVVWIYLVCLIVFGIVRNIV